jgi:phosphatidylserine decarboxylase
MAQPRTAALPSEADGLMSAFSFATAQLLRVLPRTGITRIAGGLADHRWSPSLGRAVVRLYTKAYDVNLGECPKSDGFESFDEFFTRPLRDGMRTVDPRAGVVVSPADGRVESIGRVEPGSIFQVKGRPYRVEDLVGDAEEARRYEGGAGCVIYLSPRDYHRVHAPAAGIMGRVRSLPGDYYPVNGIGLRHVPGLFARNRRVAIAIDTEDLGRVTVVMVAALIVGRITVAGIEARDVPLGDHVSDPPKHVGRGDEIGKFHLGSTAVLFLEPKAAGSWVVQEGPVQMGQALCRADASATNGNGRRRA